MPRHKRKWSEERADRLQMDKKESKRREKREVV